MTNRWIEQKIQYNNSKTPAIIIKVLTILEGILYSNYNKYIYFDPIKSGNYCTQSTLYIKSFMREENYSSTLQQLQT